MPRNKLINKEIEKILANNLKVNRYVVDGYILYQNKHIPEGLRALYTKYEKLKKFVEDKCYGKIYKMSDGFIEGDNLCYRIEIKITIGEFKTIFTSIR